MNIPKEHIEQWLGEDTTGTTAWDHLAQRAAEWALSQPVSMEPDWKHLYEIEKKRKQAIYDKYERDIAKLPRIVPMDAAPEPMSMEPVAYLVRKKSWHEGNWECAPGNSADYGRLWADERIAVFTATQLATARQQGAEEERARLNLIVDKARADQEEHENQALRERDEYHEVADDLAAQIAAITGEDIGEHSSANNPWHNAMLAADDFIAGQLKELLAGKSEKQRIADLEKSNAVLLEALETLVESICTVDCGEIDRKLAIKDARAAIAEVKP